MPAAIIALKLSEGLEESYEGDLIGADAGAYVLAKEGRHMKLAIGDFDSLETKEDLELIRQYADQVIALNPIKDDSDSEAAITEMMKRGYDKLILLGATGGRADHSLVNLRLAYKYPGKVILKDARNLIYACEKGTYTIEKKDYPYISFFTAEKAEITLEGMKYSLDHRSISLLDLYTLSNEITGTEGTLIVHEGKVLVIQCRD